MKNIWRNLNYEEYSNVKYKRNWMIMYKLKIKFKRLKSTGKNRNKTG